MKIAGNWSATPSSKKRIRIIPSPVTNLTESMKEFMMNVEVLSPMHKRNILSYS